MKVIQIVYFLLLTSFCYAQDKIIKKTGESINCKIAKEDSLNVYFEIDNDKEKKSSFIPKSRIHSFTYDNRIKNISDIEDLIEIRENKKYYLGDKQLKHRGIKNLLSQNTDAFQKYKSAKNKDIIVVATALTSGWFYGQVLSSIIFNKYMSGKSKTYYLGGGTVLFGISSILDIKSKNQIREAVKLYNSSLTSLNNKEDINLTFGMNPNGIGIVVHF
jgi:hypothetical protein